MFHTLSLTQPQLQLIGQAIAANQAALQELVTAINSQLAPPPAPTSIPAEESAQ